MNLFSTTTGVLIALCSIASAASNVGNERELTSSGRQQVTSFNDIRLLSSNEIEPSVGVPFAFGMAVVELKFRARAPLSSRWRVCIETSVSGFIPGLLQIHTANISSNGPVVVDFSSMLSNDDASFDGCVSVTKAIFDAMKSDPDLYYVSAHVGSEPEDLASLGIRGQLIQKFTTKVRGSEAIRPFTSKTGAFGTASVFVDAAGTSLCIDATLTGFDPTLAFLNMGKAGVNGKVVADFTSLNVAPGRYLGCDTLENLDVDEMGDLVNALLADSVGFYVNFHDGDTDSIAFQSTLRGQLD